MRIDTDSGEAVFGWLERRYFGVEKRMALGSVPCHEMIQCAAARHLALKQNLGVCAPSLFGIASAFTEQSVKDAIAIADGIRAYQMGMSPTFVPEDVEMGWRPGQRAEPES